MLWGFTAFQVSHFPAAFMFKLFPVQLGFLLEAGLGMTLSLALGALLMGIKCAETPGLAKASLQQQASSLSLAGFVDVTSVSTEDVSMGFFLSLSLSGSTARGRRRLVPTLNPRDQQWQRASCSILLVLSQLHFISCPLRWSQRPCWGFGCTTLALRAAVGRR